jgi:hypothetical protein
MLRSRAARRPVVRIPIAVEGSLTGAVLDYEDIVIRKATLELPDDR